MLHSRYFGMFLMMMTLLCGICLLFYFNKKIIHLHTLQHIEKKIRFELTMQTHVQWNEHFFNEKPFVTASVLQEIVHDVEESGFDIETLQPWPKVTIISTRVLPVDIVIMGPFNQWNELLNHLLRNQLLIGINHFLLQIDDHGNARISMHFLVLNNINTIKYKNIATLKPDLLHTVTLSTLKFAGYLHDQKHFLGLVKLPNGDTKIVQQGNVIGVEKGHIIHITENQITLSVDQVIVNLKKSKLGGYE